MGSLLRAALGPKPGHPWPAWGYYNDQEIALPDMDHPVKETHGRVSISREFMFRSSMSQAYLVWDWRYVQWNFVILSGKYIYMRSEPLDRSVCTPVDAVTILLIGVGSTWTEGRPSHSVTMECVWLLGLSDNDGRRA